MNKVVTFTAVQTDSDDGNMVACSEATLRKDGLKDAKPPYFSQPKTLPIPPVSARGAVQRNDGK
jgi:hypothetical protein